MAWIESHTVLGRHRKLLHLASLLGTTRRDALGLLQLLWHAALEQQEDGDLSVWDVRMVAGLVDHTGDPEALAEALRVAGWMDKGVLHDWLDYAGRFLEGRYRTSDPARLVDIWAKHGRTYELSEQQRKIVLAQGKNIGRKKAAKRLPKVSPPYRTVPNRTEPTDVSAGGAALAVQDPAEAPAFQAFMDGFLRDYLRLSPGDPDQGKRQAVGAAYRRFGRAGRDILAMAEGDAAKARAGLDAVGRRMLARGLDWTLDTVAQHYLDWAAGPQEYERETKIGR